MVLRIALALVLATPPHARVEVRVRPSVLQQGDAVRVTCRADPDASNRWLTMGIDGYRETGIQIDGERGPVTTEVLYEHVPCTTGVYCQLLDNTRKVFTARARLLVADCEPTNGEN